MFSGKIIPLNMAEHNNEIICQKDAFLCAALGTTLDISFSRKLGRGFFSGEGLFLAVLHGYGTVYLQSLPFSRLADRIIASAPSQGGNNQGEGSLLGGVANIFERT